MKSIGMRPVHPGEILSEEFLELVGISAAGLASRLNESVGVITGLVMQIMGVSPGRAKKLSICLETTPEFWLSLQSTYDLRKAEVERGCAFGH
ncbi:XRE family transcriptional regulator [Pseudomonas fluorescens HK44]|uniref:XRE family transcriptional regulator n=1 Tax=Pseudomonas fluorescens HK44 TaxID=1042209 RepID=A0A010T2Q0_PSEFL|nr:HigA family addiction module antitoxin [Pseudomonas fluorescens]EXF91862.1 XRE family transcriptional regulator [Pseudomonas fluorescens HK44]